MHVQIQNGMLTKTRLENVNSEFREGLKRKVSSTCNTCECNRLHWWVLQVLCLLDAAEMLWTEWYRTAHRSPDDPALENLFQWGGRPLCDAYWARFYKDHLYDAYIGDVDMGDPTSQKFQALIAAVDEFVFAHDKRPFEKAVLGDDAIVNEEAEAKMRQDIESSDVRHWSQCPTNRDWTRASYVALMDGAVVRMGLTVDNFSGPHLTGAANPPVHRHPSVSDHACFNTDQCSLC